VGETDTELKELDHLFREMMKNPKNMRPNTELPFIFETRAIKRVVGASLLQEITAEGGCKEKAWIYAASRSFKSAETRYCAIRRDVLTDHRPLVGLLKKALFLNRERVSS
jgi:hypothetical protein